MIGFGYTDATNTNSPAYIGYEEASTSGDTYGDLTFYTRSVITDTAPSERMRIDSSGNVTVNSDGSIAALDNVYGIQVGNSAVTTAGLALETSNRGYLWYIGSGTSSLNLWDSTANSDRLTIDSSGNVGIGTTPSNRLDVFGSSDGTIAAFGNGQDNAYLMLQAAVNFGSDNNLDNKWSLRWRGRPNVGGHSFAIYDEENSAERLHINSVGGVTLASSVGASSLLRLKNTSNTSGDFSLVTELGANAINTSSYQIICGTTAGSDRFYVYGNGNVVNINNSYGALSDERLKENIVDSGSQWNDIKALTVRKYSMKEDNLDAPNMLGVIAQEVEASGMNGLVFESPDRQNEGETIKQVNYSVLYMKAVKALQEAMTRIETLETKVATLEAN